MSDFLGFISTQKLFIVFSPLSYGNGGSERVAGGRVGVWPLTKANPPQNWVLSRSESNFGPFEMP